jgi:hypothetical protein
MGAKLPYASFTVWQLGCFDSLGFVGNLCLCGFILWDFIVFLLEAFLV